jgi:hypothetical protein
MIQFKGNGLSKKEANQIFSLLQEVKDPFCDAFITKQNLRLMIQDNFEVFKSCLKLGDKIAFDADGLAAVIGYSDNAPRKYLKILVKDLEHVPALVKTLYWNVKTDIFVKVKNNNPLKDMLLRNGFNFIGGRGKEVLLVHNYIARPTPQYTFSKDRDEDE